METLLQELIWELVIGSLGLTLLLMVVLLSSYESRKSESHPITETPRDVQSNAR